MAVSDEQIARINFLARKAKGEGLSLAERQEQIELRQAYIQAVKDSLTPLLESIRVVEVKEEVDIVSVQMDTTTTEIEAVYMERVETDLIMEPDAAEVAEMAEEIAELALPDIEEAAEDGAFPELADVTAEPAYAVESDDLAMALHPIETAELDTLEDLDVTGIPEVADFEPTAETGTLTEEAGWGDPVAEPGDLPGIEPMAIDEIEIADLPELEPVAFDEAEPTDDANA